MTTTTLVLEPPCAFINANDRELVAHFAVAGEPASKARARFTGYGYKVRAYTPAKTKTAENGIAAAYLAVAAPNTDLDTAFGVSVTFLHETGQRRDVDNMLKLVLDALNKLAFPDDVQVTHVEAVKRRVPKGEARTEVAVYKLGRIEKPRGRCLSCGTEFAQYASTSARKYCTQECGYAYRRENRTRNCLNCGVEFLSSHGATYCDRACSSQHKRVELACAHCAAAFTKPRSLANKGVPTCSPECRRAYHRERQAAAAKGTCCDCGGPTSKKTYVRCRHCNYAAGGRWAPNKHVRKLDE